MDQHIDEITRIAATKSPAKINKQNLTAVGMDINKDDPYAVAGFNRFAGAKKEEKPTPTEADIAYAKAHPEVKDKFVARFGREP